MRIQILLACTACVACSSGSASQSGSPNGSVPGAYDADAGTSSAVFGPPTFIAASLHGPRPLAADDTRVYFGTEDGHIYAVAFDGSGLTSLATGEGEPADIRVDEGAVYWSSQGTIRKVERSGGTPVTLAAGQSHDRIALGPSDVYWGASDAGAVRKVAKGGGVVIDLATGLDSPSGIAVDADGIYFATNGDGTIRAMTLDGKNQRPLAVGQDSPHAVIVEGDRVYWTTESRVASVAKSGGEPVNHAPVARSPQWVVADATYLYYANTDRGAVERVPKAGGPMESLVQMGDTMQGIAVRGRALFFASADSGVVGRVTW